jgi:hypothetical protein
VETIVLSFRNTVHRLGSDLRPKLLDRYLFKFEHLAVEILGPSASSLARNVPMPSVTE